MLGLAMVIATTDVSISNAPPSTQVVRLAATIAIELCTYHCTNAIVPSDAVLPFGYSPRHAVESMRCDFI